MLKEYYYALDPGGAGGTEVKFVNSTNVNFGATFYEEQMNLEGAAGATVTVQVTTLTITNSFGQLLVDGIAGFLNYQFPVVLDGSGNGAFDARVQGAAGETGTIVRAIFTIVGVTIGQIGSPNTKQISKTF